MENEIRAKKFVLVDQFERPRAEFGVNAEGTVSMTLNDHAGKIRAQMSVDAYGVPALTLFESTGVERAHLRVSSDGNSNLRLSDANGKSKAALLVSGDGQMYLRFADKDDTNRLMLEYNPEIAGLAIDDKEGKRRLVLSLDEGGRANINLGNDGFDNPPLVLSSNSEFSGLVLLRDGTTRVGLGLPAAGEEKEEIGVFVYNKAGEGVAGLYDSGGSANLDKILDGVKPVAQFLGPLIKKAIF